MITDPVNFAIEIESFRPISSSLLIKVNFQCEDFLLRMLYHVFWGSNFFGSGIRSEISSIPTIEFM
jgi:hypothetical protein